MTGSRIPWSRLAAEFVVIVIGVLVALGADAWWEGRADRLREASQLRALHRDFQENIARLDSTIALQQLPVAAQTEVLRVAHGFSPEPSLDSMSTLFARSLFFYRFDPVTGAYDALVGSGDIGLIRNDAISSALAAWVGVVRDGYEDEDLATLTRVELHRAMAQHLSVLALYEPAQLEFLELPPIPRPGTVTALLRDSEVVSLLGSLAFAERNMLEDYLRKSRTDAVAIVGLIEAELMR